jgi:CheY-like chemotaxis protein
MTTGEKHRIVIADDEPDIATVTKLSLKGLSFGKPLEFVAVASGADTVEALRARPDTSVLLLDVVMETKTAGLDACRAIRNDLGNKFVRILLRTGQPGVAPERTAIEQYDIDGYLPKAELTTNRLYAAVRAALKSYEELIELERHRSILNLVHQSVLSLHSFEPPETSLQRILSTAMAVAPSPLAVLHLITVEEGASSRDWTLHIAAGAEEEKRVADVVKRAPNGDGTFIPIRLHRNLGDGWIYLDRTVDDALTRTSLELLASHASNALYSAVAQSILSDREKPFYDTLGV